LGNLASIVLSRYKIKKILGTINTPSAKKVSIKELLKINSIGVINDIATMTYFSLPTILIALVSPVDVPFFSLAEKIQRYAKSSINPIILALQGWVFTGKKQLKSRIYKSTQIIAVVSVIYLFLYIILLPFVSEMLSNNTIHLGVDYSIPFAIILSAGLIAMGTGMIGLLALNLAKFVTLSAILGACIGILTLYAGTKIFGGVGAAWSIAITETLVLIYQSYQLKINIDLL
jgi:hypothetical protein